MSTKTAFCILTSGIIWCIIYSNMVECNYAFCAHKRMPHVLEIVQMRTI